jgi:hypothetical protein
MKHKCKYCGKDSNQNRDALIESGWSFVDIRAPKRAYLQACNSLECYGKFRDESHWILKH